MISHQRLLFSVLCLQACEDPSRAPKPNVCVWMCVCACMQVCVCVYMHVCRRVLRMCAGCICDTAVVRICMPAYVHAYTHVWVFVLGCMCAPDLYLFQAHTDDAGGRATCTERDYSLDPEAHIGNRCGWLSDASDVVSKFALQAHPTNLLHNSAGM